MNKTTMPATNAPKELQENLRRLIQSVDAFQKNETHKLLLSNKKCDVNHNTTTRGQIHCEYVILPANIHSTEQRAAREAPAASRMHCRVDEGT